MKKSFLLTVFIGSLFIVPYIMGQAQFGNNGNNGAQYSTLPQSFINFLSPGNNISFTTNGQILTISSSGGGGSFTGNANQFGTDGAGANVIKSGAPLTNTMLVAPVFAMANLVPAGANYDNGVAQGFPIYAITVVAGAAYYVNTPGNGSGNDQGAITPDETLSVITGIIVPDSTTLWLYANSPSTPVTASVYLATNNVYGSFNGVLNGSFIGDATAATLNTNVQLHLSSLLVFNNAGAVHRLISQATTGNDPGSTLSLIHIGNSTDGGYADINFETAPDLANAYGSPTLHFAIGVGMPDSGTIYNEPYFESYLNGANIYYVGAGAKFGGFLHGAGDWVWYLDGTTNTPMFQIDRPTGTISNYDNTICKSNLTILSTGWFHSSAMSNTFDSPLDIISTMTNRAAVTMLSTLKVTAIIGGRIQTDVSAATNITFNSAGEWEKVSETSASTLGAVTINLPTTTSIGQEIRFVTLGSATLAAVVGTQRIGASVTSITANGSLCWIAYNTSGGFDRVQ